MSWPWFGPCLGQIVYCAVVQTDLASGGTLWFLDLTSPDSTWILPICLGLTNLFIIEVSVVSHCKVT